MSLEYKTSQFNKVPCQPGLPAESQPLLNKANNNVRNEAIFFPLLKKQWKISSSPRLNFTLFQELPLKLPGINKMYRSGGGDVTE